MIGFASRPWPELSERRTQLALGAAALAAVVAAFAFAIGTGALRATLVLAGLAAAPLLLAIALRNPYLFPYGLYVALVPFDELLALGSGGTLTKALGFASALFIGVYALRRRALALPSRAVYAWLAFLAWALVSVLWAPESPNLRQALQQVPALILMYAVLAVAPIEERQLRAVCAAIVAGGVVASWYGIWTLHHLPPESGRLVITAGARSIDPNHFGNALLAPLAFALVALVRVRTPAAALRMATAVGSVGAGILLSLSREAILAAAAIVLVTIAFSRRRLLGFAIAVPALAALPLLVPALAQRILDAFATGGAGRFSIWHVGWLAWRAHPIAGWGLGGELDAYDRNFLAVYQAYNAGWGRPLHDSPLHIAVELGIVGLALAAVAFAATFVQLRAVRRGERLWDLRVALTAALLGVAIASLFIDLTTYKYAWIVLIAIAQLRTAAMGRGARRRR